MTDSRTVTATSTDGTTIGARIVGSGRPIVIVPGSIATGDQWQFVADALGDRYACWLVDRRGRGLSGDADEYSLELEADDIAAVLAEAGPDAVLVAHSFGAIAALEALRRGAAPAAVVLYEPPLPVSGLIAGDALEPFAALVDDGQLDDALTLAFTDIVHVPAEVVAGMRQTPAWPGMAELTPTWVRELREIDALPADVDRYRDIAVPVVFILGEVTAPHHVAATEALLEVLPDARSVTLPGEEHFAHLTSPDAVATVISDASTR